jgi:hypothetical protein
VLQRAWRVDDEQAGAGAGEAGRRGPERIDERGQVGDAGGVEVDDDHVGGR